MNNAPAAADAKAIGRERQQYRLNEIITFERDEMGKTDATLEDLLTTIELAIRDDGVIDSDEQQDILLSAQAAYKSNASALQVVTLLDESGSEAGLREVERIRQKRQNTKRVK